MAGKNTSPETQEVEIVVAVDGHIHEGEICTKGTKIKVFPLAAKMLEAQWAKAKEEK